MDRGVVKAFVIVVLIFGTTFISIGTSYWKYAVQGEKISATVTDVESYRSGSKRKRTRYIYTLETTIRGALVEDTYHSGSYHTADVGDVVDVYVTNDAEPELALTTVKNRDPLWLLLIVALFGLIVFGLKKQRKLIATGRVKLSLISKSKRQKKLEELKNPGMVERTPQYSIGESTRVPKGGDDGRNYPVS